MGLNDAYNLLWLETQKEHKNNLTLNLTFLVPSAASNNFFCPSKHKAHTPKSPPHNLGSHPNPCSLLYTTFVWMRLVTGHYVTVEKGRTAQQMSALWKQPCCLTWSWQWPNHHTIIWPPEEACVGGGAGTYEYEWPSHNHNMNRSQQKQGATPKTVQVHADDIHV